VTVLYKAIILYTRIQILLAMLIIQTSSQAEINHGSINEQMTAMHAPGNK
jgi:hypothetical protein